MKKNDNVPLKKTGSPCPGISIFSLFGNSEPVATNILAYLLYCSEVFFYDLLRSLKNKPSQPDFKNTQILREHIPSSQSTKDRTDIELVAENKLHIIFEAKMGNNIPSKRQCEKYIARLLRNQPSVFVSLVLLVNDSKSCDKEIQRYSQDKAFRRDIIQLLEWSTVKTVLLQVIKKNIPGACQPYLIEFWKFLERDYYMRSYQQEIMIVGINNHFTYKQGSYPPLVGKNSEEGVRKLNIYEGGKGKMKSVIYIAFRLNGKLQFFAKVKEQQPINNQMVFFLEEIIELPIVRKVPYGYRQGVQHTTFQKLLDPKIKDFKGLIET